MKKSVHSRQYTSFIEKLIDARKEAGFTQQQVAGRLGKPQSFVAKYENGERRLDVIEFLAIAKILKANPKAIIGALEAGD